MGNSNKRSKGYLIAVLVIFILALAAGYAAFVDTLTITGTANANGTFDMIFESCEVTKKVGVTDATASFTEENDKLTVSVVDLAYPGAGAQFDVVIKNNGTMPAAVKTVTANGIEGTTNIKIEGLDAITTEHPVIAAGKTCEFSFTVEWDVESTTELTAEEKAGITFDLAIEYEQANAKAFEGTASHNDPQ